MRRLDSKLFYDLLSVVEMQQDMINKQDGMIADLINENLEKENMINELMKMEDCLY